MLTDRYANAYLDAQWMGLDEIRSPSTTPPASRSASPVLLLPPLPEGELEPPPFSGSSSRVFGAGFEIISSKGNEIREYT